MSTADEGSKDRIAEFTEFRQRMNQRILGEPNQVVRRFFALDTQTYQPGEFFETFSVGLVVGGSIVIPHLRRAVDFLDQLEGGADAPAVHEH